MPTWDDNELAYQYDDTNDQFHFSDVGLEELGPYVANLYTTGGELWLHKGAVSGPPITLSSLNEGNSYKGWYHIRNKGSEYELILPTRYANEDYDGSPLLTPVDWFRNNGFYVLAESLQEQIEDSPVMGCTNPNAVNYNPYATQDNGTCEFINNWFLGEIPPKTLTHLFTEGGELYDSRNNNDYQGWYHIHGVTNLPNGVAAGSIMAGNKFWMSSNDKPEGQPDNFLLLPYDVDKMLYYQNLDVALHEYNLRNIPWNKVFKREMEKYPTLEDQNLQSITSKGTIDTPYRITHTSHIGGRRSEVMYIDNVFTTFDVKKMMKEVDYQFSELIPDPNLSPGIFGSKPIMKGDINIMSLSAPDDGNRARYSTNNLKLGGGAEQAPEQPGVA
mgnify:CR=1 FL=1